MLLIRQCFQGVPTAKLKIASFRTTDHLYLGGTPENDRPSTRRADAGPMPVFPALRARFLGAPS